MRPSLLHFLALRRQLDGLGYPGALDGARMGSADDIRGARAELAHVPGAAAREARALLLEYLEILQNSAPIPGSRVFFTGGTH